MAPRKDQVPISRPSLGEDEANAAARVVRSGWLMQGPEVAAFEGELASAVGAAHAIACSNGTAALELALRGLGIGPGDEVITVSHSFIASATAIVSVGATPVMVDVQADTLCIDPDQVKRALGPRTRAVMAVHQIGFPADLATLLPLCSGAGVFLIEDAACALGSEIQLAGQWQRLGRPHGDVACLSFHPRKILTTGEGGMVLCRDAALAKQVRLLRQHGLAQAGPVDRGENVPDGFQLPASNLRLTDLAAAVGRCQLVRLDALIAERRRLAKRYDEALRDHPVLAGPTERADHRTNWQSFPVFLRPETRYTAPGVLRFLEQRGISGRAGLTNAHQEPAFTRKEATGSFRVGPMPVSLALRRNTVFLPLFAGLTDNELDRVLGALSDLRTAPPTF